MLWKDDYAARKYTDDPMVAILAAFRLIPDNYQNELFEDFRGAAESHDLRRLLDTISDWAATAQLYDHPTLARDLHEATRHAQGGTVTGTYLMKT